MLKSTLDARLDGSVVAAVEILSRNLLQIASLMAGSSALAFDAVGVAAMLSLC